MPQRTHKTGSLFGGVSRQPPHLRRENQVEEATNVSLTVARGATSRPGTRYDRAVTIASYPASGLRIHPIERDATERYILMYGDGVMRAFRDGGNESVVYQHSIPRLYMAGSGADDWRLVTIADTTLIADAAGTITSKTSPSYTTTGDAPSATSLFSRTVTPGEVWRATQDDVVAAAGYWKYAPGNNTYAKLVLPDTNATWSTPSTHSTTTFCPSGARVFFGTFPCVATIAAGAWTAATKIVTMPANTFTNLTFQEGMYLNVTAVTAGGVIGYHKIARVISGTQVEMVDDAISPGVNRASLTIDGVGFVGEMKVDFQVEDGSDMHKVALAYQKSLQASLGQPALVAWVPELAGTGHMEITSPWSGVNAHFPASPTALRSPSSADTYDFTTVALTPFYATGTTTTAGTGVTAATVRTADSLWEHVPAPAQATAQIDETTAPQQLQRVHDGGTWDWVSMTNAMLPFAYYRFQNATGSLNAFDTAGTHNGTLSSTSAAVGSAGPTTISGSLAMSCGTAPDRYANLGSVSGLGNFLDRGFTIEFMVKTAISTMYSVVGMGVTTSGSRMGLHIRGNTNDGSTDTANAWWFHLSDSAGLALTVKTTGSLTATNDFAWHLVSIAVRPDTNTVTVSVDGVAQTVTTITTQTPTTFTDNEAIYPLTLGAYLATTGGTVTTQLSGLLTEVTFHPGVFSSDMTAARAGLFMSSSYSLPEVFVFSPIDWSPRYSGEPLTNPLPEVFKGTLKVTAMSYFENRLWLGGGPNIAGSQVDDLFNFYADDADNIVDSDPIDAPLSDDKSAANVSDLVSFRKAMLVLTDGPRQYELSSEGKLSPSTVTLSATTAYRPLSVRPAAMDQAVYSVASGNQGANLMEYFPDESVSVLSAFNVSAHADGYLPATIRRIQAHSQTGRVFVLNSAKTTIFPYTTYWEGNKKIQSAWAKWTFVTDLSIEDMAVLGDELWTLQKLGSVWTLERMGCSEESTRNGLAESTHLDRQYVATGSYGGADTTWTFPVSDPTINRAILLTGAGTVGTQVTVSTTGATVTATGADYSGGQVILGRAFTQEVELSEPYFKDPTGAASLNDRKSFREVIVEHTDTGGYALVASTSGCTDRTETFTATVNSPQAVGELRAFPGGSTRDTTLTIRNATARRFTVSAVETVLDVDGRVPQ